MKGAEKAGLGFKVPVCTPGSGKCVHEDGGVVGVYLESALECVYAVHVGGARHLRSGKCVV